MLSRKKVVVDDTHMHLWDEMGNYVSSYDRQLEEAACRFLTDMVESNIYDCDGEEAAARSIAA